jgi:AraC family transcriptional regulator, ethanolamine operon transcriptional activator
MSHHPESASTRYAVLDAQYGDVDEQAAALTGWNQSYMQLLGGGFRGDMCQLGLDGVRIFREGLSTSVYQTGLLAPGSMALGVPLRCSGPGLFCGEPCHLDSLHVFSGSTGFEFRTATEHVMLGIELSPALRGSLEALDEEGPGVPSRAGIHAADPVALADLRQFLCLLFEAAHSTPDLLGVASLRHGMVDALLDKIAALHTQARSSTNTPRGRWRLVHEARQLIEQRLAEPPSIATLCAELGVSRRTLQSGFHQVLGVSPLSYLRAVRLHRVRQSLKAASSVTDAATQHGFWHFGHFAQDYQAMFGERPSQTLQRSRKAS